MRLKRDKVSFGRHEKFALRFTWLPKGIQALENDCKVFESDDATVRLGVGRNMVNAIRYWLRASQMIAVGSYEITEMGLMLLHPKTGYDPYLEDEATIWLLHWLVASNPDIATSHFWFFNIFQKAEFTSEELVTALGDFVKDTITIGRRPAKNTVLSDASVLSRMYTQSKINHKMPLEEVLDSPFSALRLVENKPGERIFVSRHIERPSLPVEILGYAVLSALKDRGQKIVPVEDLMYSKDGRVVPGAVFRISENDFIRKLELLLKTMPELELRDSNGIHQLFVLEDVAPEKLLKRYYEMSRGAFAA